MITQGSVAPLPTVSISDGVQPTLMMGKQAELMTAALMRDIYEQTLRGNTFHATTTPLGLAIPIYTATAPTVALWNPAGSGKNAVLQKLGIVYASGTADFAAVGLMRRTGVGSTVATGAVFTAFAEATPINGLIGAGATSAMKVAIAGTVTLTAAGAAGDFFYILAGINLEAQTGTAHATALGVHEFHGEVIVPPGVAVWLAATKASSALYAQTLTWTEAPV